MKRLLHHLGNAYDTEKKLQFYGEGRYPSERYCGTLLTRLNKSDNGMNKYLIGRRWYAETGQA